MRISEYTRQFPVSIDEASCSITGVLLSALLMTGEELTVLKILTFIMCIYGYILLATIVEIPTRHYLKGKPFLQQLLPGPDD